MTLHFFIKFKFQTITSMYQFISEILNLKKNVTIQARQGYEKGISIHNILLFSTHINAEFINP